MVEVGHRPGILDPQGGAIERALPALGYDNVSEVRVGKSIRLGSRPATRTPPAPRSTEMCDRLLANPVIEDFTVDVVAAGGSERR